jgi:hypothetical protein
LIAEFLFQEAEDQVTRGGKYSISVKETSSILRLPQFLETKVDVAADHVNMVKFDTPEDTTYKAVHELVKKMLFEAPSVVANRFCE